MSTARVIPFTSDSLESTAVMERYRKAYQTAQRAIDFAETSSSREFFWQVSFSLPLL